MKTRTVTISHSINFIHQLPVWASGCTVEFGNQFQYIERYTLTSLFVDINWILEASLSSPLMMRFVSAAYRERAPLVKENNYFLRVLVCK